MTALNNNAAWPKTLTTNNAAAGVSLKSVKDRAAVAARIKNDIDAWALKTFDDGHRTHLGASLIGRPCSRYLWYTFRWVQKPKFNGRMQRLFQRGHREEAWYIQMLEGIGARVEFEDTSGAQFRISGCEGHFGGSLDAKLWLPEHYGLPLMFINEYKTQGTGKFSKMTLHGVQIEKPEHFTQMSMYGWKNDAQYGVYMAVNKNDDDLHVEVVELDHALAQRSEAKAHAIIFTRTPPQKLSESIAHSVCGWCDFKGVCHQNEPYEKNCRSCKHVEAIPDKKWGCHKFANVVPGDFIVKGCDAWEAAL